MCRSHGSGIVRGVTKRRQVTAILAGRLFNCAVVGANSDSLYLWNGQDLWFRVNLNDEGREWIEGQQFEGSMKANALMTAWTLYHQKVE